MIDENETFIGDIKMSEDLQACITNYQEQLIKGDIQKAYVALIKYVSELKVHFPKSYQTGNLSLGYLDYTYFPFTNPWLKSKKLRFGIVLNHRAMCIECWLLGQNATMQKTYWEILKDSKWNQYVHMPKYSILETVLEEHIDFSRRQQMTDNVLNQAVIFAKEIENYLKNVA